jgi:DNA-binding SARP family transcriptional activator
MRFGVLGPVEVWDGQRRVPVGGPQQRGLLAVLLLRANQVVSVDRLVDSLWGDQPPATARGLLQGCVAGLRRVLREAGVAGRLETAAPGYRLRVEPGELDLDRFEQLAGEADRVGDPVRAGELLAQALAVWRGPALDGVDLAGSQAEVARLEERRLAVREQRIDLGLQRGAGPELAGELQALVQAHPLRERLWAQLMLSLYEADRRADALDAYQRLRRTLVEQLGVEPAASVQQLHRTILAGGDARAENPARSPAASPPGPADAMVPAQLPAAAAGFAGRADALKRLDELLADAGQGLRVGIISGMAGVGKTTLAIHWGHGVRDRFADGQLYVNLRGYSTSPPMPVIEALTGFLQALGVPAEQVPTEPDPAAALYRSLLADRRILVMLDNAHSLEQVRPLLPGGDGCLVLVTSRDMLRGLVAAEGAAHLGLDVLNSDEAGELLRRVLDRERVLAEPATAAELARLCGYLPLALRIAAANLRLHPRWRIADQVSQLAGDDRLGELTVDRDETAAVRAAFDLSYDSLDSPGRRLFRLLGLVPGPDFTAQVAAAAGRIPLGDATRQLDRLAAAHLIEQRSPDRFGLHDLLRVYAVECVRREDTVEEREATARDLAGWYLRSADAAAAILYPEKIRLPLPAVESPPALAPLVFDSPAQALSWLDTERSNLVAVVTSAATAGPRPAAWRLASVLYGYFYLSMYTHDWRVVARSGLAAALAAGDLPGQAAQLLSLGALYERTGDYSRAGTHYARALALSQRAGWLEGHAVALANLGILHRRGGRLQAAAEHYTRALEIDRRSGWRPGIAARLVSLGNIYAELGQLARAAEHYTEALEVNRETGSRSGQAIMRANLGQCCLLLGRIDEAIDLFTAARELNQEIGDRDLVADNHRALATAHRDAGRYGLALDLARTAVALVRETGGRRYEADALNALGSIHLCLDQVDQALEHHRTALELARATGERLHETSALVGLSAVHIELGEVPPGLAQATEAVTLARRHSYRLLEGPATIALAAAHLAAGEPDRAAEEARRAVELCRTTGQRLDEARADRLLGQATLRIGRPAA